MFPRGWQGRGLFWYTDGVGLNVIGFPSKGQAGMIAFVLYMEMSLTCNVLQNQIISDIYYTPVSVNE